MFSTLAVAVSFRNTTSSCFGGSMEISFLRCNDTVTSSLIVQKRLGVRGRDGRLEAVRVWKPCAYTLWTRSAIRLFFFRIGHRVVTPSTLVELRVITFLLLFVGPSFVAVAVPSLSSFLHTKARTLLCSLSLFHVHFFDLCCKCSLDACYHRRRAPYR